MSDQTDPAKLQLAALLRDQRAVLMAGAGLSRSMGYPMWEELANKMRRELAPSLTVPSDMSPAEQIELIKKHLQSDRRGDDYFNFLGKEFQPRASGRNCDDLHLSVVQMGFCGLVTTNYDLVLETAVIESTMSGGQGAGQCRPVDLCEGERLPVFELLRGLTYSSNKKQFTAVLHLHGCYEHPRELILTPSDYRSRYGEMSVDRDGRPTSIVLDSEHRKVLWSLLVMHSLVFIGFSFADEAFKYIWNVVKSDFKLGTAQVHYALFGVSNDEQRQKYQSLLANSGVCPVFYPVTICDDPPQTADHRALKALVVELQELAGTGDLASATAKMLSR